MPRKKIDDFISTPLPPPAKTLEGREAQMINAATNLVERRIYNETASAQEVVHYLRLGSVKNQLEQEKLRQENEVLRARVVEMEQRSTSEATYKEALQAFRGYAGQEVEDDDPELY